MQPDKAAPQTKEDVPSLVARARSGDGTAYRELCERLAPAVRAFAQRRLRQRDAVDDFIQDALLTFVEALQEGRIEDPTRAAAFALGICRNLARERAKVRDRRRAAVERFGDFPDATPPEEPKLLNSARLEDCLSQLTGRAREVLKSSYFEDHSDAEIATALSINASHVRVIRHRSIAALRECVETPVIAWRQ